MKLIDVNKARKILEEEFLEAKRAFIEKNENLLDEIFSVIEDSCKSFRYSCLFHVSKDRITNLESEILVALLEDWGYKANILPNYVNSYALEVSWHNE